MTLQCPQCGNSVPDDFGVVTCSSCQTVLFIDLEGRIQIQSSDGPLNQPTFVGERASFGAPPVEEFVQSVNESLGSEFIPEQSYETPVGLPVLDPLGESLDPVPEPEFQDVIQIEPIPDQGQDPFAEFQSVSGPLSSSQDVENFANSDETVGALTYSVIIEDINTKEIRSALVLALDDPKFLWDARDLVKGTKDGKLLLDRLNPVKASLVVQRVKGLKVKIRWRQNVF